MYIDIVKQNNLIIKKYCLNKGMFSMMSTWTLFFFLLQFRWFQIEVLQAMEKNVKLDEEYIEVSLQRGKAPF